MTRLWEGEPITVESDAQGRPLRFSWQGRLHHIERIQQQWQVDVDWWDEGGRAWRLYLAVTTVQGVLCVIYQDLLEERWYLSKIYD